MTDTDTDTRVLRFRRPPFRDYEREPRWHVAARNYDYAREYYLTVIALCGYQATGMTAMSVTWSNAKRPPRPLCRLCKKAAA